ncbi:aspartate racemase [Desulfosporosinus orientis DSM 765]|uniref:Aspartate racemase n=1 Tax=Desulfosporosinus orientis (strain ATCC 19365 / DSM 765 / NCIMB 8382 / VKM B-1628 / Singapore I) TaxID=768706 RepID=G7WIX1_DESOD|nr:aspartate/glutamate racemase family protein [Desulfosporosinus orientis]AET69696.1 aspartate racemase [Desulfosporosinus orientis DSM 765]
MKTIGVIGGMSWESTTTYYLELNRYINQKLGGYYSAKCILYNVQYQDIKDVHKNGDWDRAGEILVEAALSLKASGADFIILATNTMHIVAPRIKEAVDLPFLHIAEVTADRLLRDNINTVALLGTRFTMEKDFYKKVLVNQGINVLIPEKDQIEKIHEIINKELILGRVESSSRECFKNIILSLQKRSAQGVILGCTEIGLLIRQEDSVLPVYDTALLHADAAADYALKD